MKCTYTFKSKNGNTRTFSSEIELDDFLQEQEKWEPKYGDLIFSKTNSQLDSIYKLDQANKKALGLEETYKRARDAAFDAEDGERVDEFNPPYIGVNKWLGTLKDDSGGPLFPQFIETNYWQDRIDHWTNIPSNQEQAEKTKGNPGRFSSDEIDIWFSIDPTDQETIDKEPNLDKKQTLIHQSKVKVANEKLQECALKNKSILTKQDAIKLKSLMQSKWRKQNLIGDAIHFVMQAFYSKNASEEYIKNLSPEEMEKAIKDKYESEFIQDKTYKKELLDDTKFQQIIAYAKTLDRHIQETLPEGELEFYPEFKITGKLSDTSSPSDTLMGIIDLLVVDKTGQIHIFDYKTSVRSYNNFDSAKKLAFTYQLAVYGRLFRQLGLDYHQAKIKILPIQLKHFKLLDRDQALSDPSTAKFDFDQIGYPQEISEDITSAIFAQNREGVQYIQENLDQYLPEPKIKDVTSTELLKTITEQEKVWFPNYIKQNMTDEEIADMIKNNGGDKPNENGKYEYKASGEYAKSIIASSPEELFKKVKKKREQIESGKLYLAKTVKEAMLEQIKNPDHTNLGEALKHIDKAYLPEDHKGALASWFRDTIGNYCNGDWEVIEDHDDLLNLGIILVRNKINQKQVDIIKLTASNPNYERKFSKGRHLLNGAFAEDLVENQNGNSLMLNSTNGNIEAIEAVLALNNLPSIFQGSRGNLVIGRIKIINPYMGTGVQPTNEQLMYSLKTLQKYSPMIAKDNISTGLVKFAPLWEIGWNTLITTMSDDSKFKLNSREEYQDLINSWDSYADTNSQGKLTVLKQVISKMESQYPMLKNMKPEEIQTFLGKDSHPEVGVYAELLVAYNSLLGINQKQQLRDHDKYVQEKTIKGILKNGLAGSYIDNTGNLQSDVLNSIGTQLLQAQQNVRQELAKKAAELRKLTEALKKSKGVNLVSEKVTSPAKMFENMTEVGPDGDLRFTNINNPKLTIEEKNYLNFVLNSINQDRFKYKTKEQLERMKQTGDTDYYRVPLCRAEVETRQYATNLLKALKERIKSIDPRKALTDLREGNLFEDDSTDPKGEHLFDITSTFDRTDPVSGGKLSDRMDFIEGQGTDFFETNLEILTLKHAYTQSVKNNIGEIMPSIRSSMAYLAVQGYTQNQNFENDLQYTEDFIRSKIKGQKLGSTEKVKSTNAMLSKIRSLASFTALAFSPVQGLYQGIQGIWNDISIIIRKPDGSNSFTLKNFKDAAKIVYKEILPKGNTPTKCQLINELYGINDMDANTYAEKLRSDGPHGLSKFWDLAFKFTSRPDYYNRMTIFIARMLADGSYDAISIGEDGTLKYDYKKDSRFSAFANNEISNPKYNEQKGLYYTIARQFVNEGVNNPDGSKFKIGDPLPAVYTAKESEAIKALSDLVYGYYDESKKSMIHATWLGGLYMQMKTYWSGKKNQYLAPGGVKLQGKWEQLKNKDGELMYYQLTKDKKAVDYDQPPTTTNSGVPYMQWKGLFQEGIMLTLRNILYDKNPYAWYNLNSYNPYMWYKHYNELMQESSPELQQAYSNNVKQFFIDITAFIIIGQLLGTMLLGDWDKELQKTAKASGQLQDAMASTLLHITTLSTINSAQDFNWLSSIGSPITQWTPFAFESLTREGKNWWNVAMGDPTFIDGVKNSFAATKQAVPLFTWIKQGTEQ